MLDRARTPILIQLLRAAHRELGMGAYQASGELPADLREHLHACATWCAPEPSAPVRTATEDVLMLGIRGAELTAAVDHDRSAAHAHAHAHALDAVTALSALVGANRAKALTRQAVETGQLERRRMPAVLASISAS